MKINGWTAVIVVAAIAGIVAMVHYKIDLTYFGFASVAMLGVVSQLAKLVHFGEDAPPPPKGPSVKDPDEASKDDGGALKKHPYREPAIVAPWSEPTRVGSVFTRAADFYRDVQFFMPHPAVVALGVVFIAGCGLLTPKSIADAVLTVADFACLETGPGSKTEDSEAAATACKLAEDPLLRDVIKNLVAQRAAAKRAGFVWRPIAVSKTLDGGDAFVETVAKDSGR